LIITRTVHDRYHAAKRNPFNEIECSDHYARAMASYGTFITACGFEYHGPKGYIGFAPKITPENFRAPFTSAEGWGTYKQKQHAGTMSVQYYIKYGNLALQTISLQTSSKVTRAAVQIGMKNIPCNFVQQDNDVRITLAARTDVKQNQKLIIKIS